MTSLLRPRRLSLSENLETADDALQIRCFQKVVSSQSPRSNPNRTAPDFSNPAVVVAHLTYLSGSVTTLQSYLDSRLYLLSVSYPEHLRPRLPLFLVSDFLSLRPTRTMVHLGYADPSLLSARTIIGHVVLLRFAVLQRRSSNSAP